MSICGSIRLSLDKHVARTFQDHDKVRRVRRGMMPKANPFVELLWNASIRAEHYSLVSTSHGNHKFVIQEIVQHSATLCSDQKVKFFLSACRINHCYR